jgi:hypothetical protein
LVASLITISVAIVYVWLIQQQGDQPALWLLGGMVLCVLFSAYGTVGTAPHRAWALAASATILIVFGVLAVASIGLPMLVAAIFAELAMVRARKGPYE